MDSVKIRIFDAPIAMRGLTMAGGNGGLEQNL